MVSQIFHCRTKGCPWPLDEDIHTPWCLGIKERQHSDIPTHQHWPKRSQGGKEIVACLCWYCHDYVDNGWHWGNAVEDVLGKRVYRLWEIDGSEVGRTLIEKEISDGAHLQGRSIYEELRLDDSPRRDGSGAPVFPTTARSGRTRRSNRDDDALVPQKIPSLSADWSGYTDDKLAAIYQQAEKAHGGAYLVMCKAVWQCRESHRQAWGESWADGAYDIFHASRRTLEGMAGFWEIASECDANLLDHVGEIATRSIVQRIGRTKAEEGAKLLEAAVDYVAEYGEPPSVPALLHKVGVDAGEKGEKIWACKDCGSTNVGKVNV